MLLTVCCCGVLASGVRGVRAEGEGSVRGVGELKVKTLEARRGRGGGGRALRRPDC